MPDEGDGEAQRTAQAWAHEAPSSADELRAWLEQVIEPHLYDLDWSEPLAMLGRMFADRPIDGQADVETYVAWLIERCTADILVRPLDVACQALGEAGAAGETLARRVARVLADEKLNGSVADLAERRWIEAWLAELRREDEARRWRLAERHSSAKTETPPSRGELLAVIDADGARGALIDELAD